MNLHNLIQIINKGKTKFEIEIYLVGGAVRDLLLGSSPTDLDFVFIDEIIIFSNLFQIHLVL